MSYEPKYKKYLVPVENQQSLNHACHGFKIAQSKFNDYDISEDDAKVAVSLYDEAGKTIEQYLIDKNCLVALTNEFKFTLNLHDDREDLIKVDPLHVH